MEEKCQKKSQCPFCRQTKPFFNEIVLRGIKSCFLQDGALGLFLEQPRHPGGLLPIFKWRGWSNGGKNPWDVQQNPLKHPLTNLRALKITDSIKWYNTKNFSKRSLVVRYCRTTYAQKNPFSNQGIQKMHGNFFRPKNPKIAYWKFQTPQKSFDHPRHLKFGVPSGPRQLSIWRNLRYILY